MTMTNYFQLSVAVGTFLMALTMFYSIVKTDRKEKSKEKNRLLTLLISIRTELTVLMEREEELMGNFFKEAKEKDGAPMDIKLLKPTHSHFTVYDNSSHELIGSIGRNNKNKELAENITKAYLIAKSYFEELVYYSELWDRYMDKKLWMKKTMDEKTEESKNFSKKYVEVDTKTGTTYVKKPIGAIYNYFTDVLKKDRESLLSITSEVIREIDDVVNEANE